MSSIAEKLEELSRLKSIIKKITSVKTSYLVGTSADEDDLETLIGRLHCLSPVLTPTAKTYTCSDKTITECPQDLKDISNKVTSMASAFSNCTALTEIELPDMFNCISGAYMFSGCVNLKTVTFGDMDRCTTATAGLSCFPTKVSFGYVGNANMFKMFTKVEDLELRGLDNQITSLSLSTCKALKKITFGTSAPNVSNMSSCFKSCTSLTSISLPDLPNVTNMSYCFYGCSSLSSIVLPDLPKVTNMYACFSGCTSLQSLTISSIGSGITSLSNWYLSNTTLITEDSLVNILNALPETSTSKICTLGTTNLGKLTDDEKLIATGKGWTLN